MLKNNLCNILIVCRINCIQNGKNNSETRYIIRFWYADGYRIIQNDDKDWNWQ